jgi:two-component system, OmpR family, phosphate regulon response regulator PhoB
MSDLILIVEDEQDLAKTLAYNLEREGYQTVVANNGGDALKSLSPLPDLVLLDLMLPDMSGKEVCRQLKADERTRHVPVVMLTAKAEEMDRVIGFEVGADDYVVKPFSVRELMLRVKAIRRRSQPPAPASESAELSLGRLRMDMSAHRVWVDSDEVVLTALEFKLLHTFATRQGRVQTREMLLSDVWGITADVTTRTVDTHVKRLRQKLGLAGDYIETLRGVGYRFSVPSAPNSSASS